MNRMTKKITFRLKILLISLVILLSIGSLGLVAYYKFSSIVGQVSEATKTDRSIALAKEILADLTTAENKVKSYTLTRNESYIDQFDSVALNIEEKIVLLYSGVKNSVATHDDMDTLIGMVHHKFDILSSILTLQNEFRVQEAFGIIEQRLDQKTALLEQTPEAEKKNFQLFKRRDKKEDNAPSQSAMKSLKQDIKSMSKQEAHKEQLLLEKELELMEEDAKVTAKISLLLKHFEKQEMQRIQNRSEMVTEEVQNIKILIAVVCVITSLFLLIMIYTIINYLRSNNRYLRMIKKAKRESEQLTRAKERFIATISHELRTPMNSIVGFTEQIAQGPLTKLQKAQIEIVKKASEHLLLLINEFLDFSRLQENKLQLTLEPFSPKSVLNEVADISSSIASAKGIGLELELNENTHQVVLGDPFRLRQILLNVIGNAIKFTPQGKVQIHALTEALDNDKINLIITVTDTGIGIDKSKLNSIFDVFEQESSSVSSEFGGSGLGLSITKRLIELHEGTISIESSKKVGTKVEIRIPYAPGQFLQLKEAPKIELKIEDIKGLHFLIVDDEKYNRDLLKAILRKWMVHVTEMEDGEMVAEHVLHNPTDLILMDVRMPIVSGIEATFAVRSLEEQVSETPIILLTAAVTEEERVGYLTSGVNMVLAKPYMESQLLEAVLNVLGKGDLKTEKKKSIKNNTINFTALKQTCGDDIQFYKEMLSTLDTSIQQAQVQLKTAYEHRDYAVMAEYAHRVCAPVKHINAGKLYSLFKQLETNCRQQKELLEIEGILDSIHKEAVLVCAEIRKELDSQLLDSN